MRRVLLILLACAVVVGAALWIALLPGAVRFEAGSLSIDAATPTLVFAGLLVLALFYALMRLIGAAIRLPHSVRRSRALRRRRDGDAAVIRTLVALAAEHQADAVAHADRARRLLGDTPQTLLLGAQAHRLAGHDAEATAQYAALAEHPEAGLLGLRGLLDEAIARGNWIEAQALADRADQVYPNSVWLRDARAKIAVHDGDWKGALQLAGPAAPRAAFAAAAAAGAQDSAEGLKLAKAAFRADPGFAPSALGYATRLRACGSDRRALAVLHEAWTLKPHPDLAEAALAGVSASPARYEAAKRLTKSNPDHPESQLLLARTALEAGDLAAAREAGDRAKVLNQRRAWALVAEIEDKIHHDSAAVRTAWQRAAAAGPDPAWRCSRCGQTQPRWSAKCANCGNAGSLVWQ